MYFFNVFLNTNCLAGQYGDWYFEGDYLFYKKNQVGYKVDGKFHSTSPIFWEQFSKELKC